MSNIHHASFTKTPLYYISVGGRRQKDRKKERKKERKAIFLQDAACSYRNLVYYVYKADTAPRGLLMLLNS